MHNIINVIDDFLPKYYFESLERNIMGSEFAWYFNQLATKGAPYTIPQFTHTFYDNRSPWNGIGSDWYHLVEPLLAKLEVEKIYRVKANLNPKTFFHRNTGYHVDFEKDPPIKTAVYYIDTNNGFTKFKKGPKVKSVANRMVIFNSNLEHAGFTNTNKHRRVVINFNYV